MEKINVDEMFRCFKCDYMVDEPHESECCGKLYCQSCVVELNFNQCKICKKAVKFRKNLFAKKLMQQVELKCRHHCGGKFMYEDMKLHLYRCDCRIFKCTIDFCSFVGRKLEIIPHLLKAHPIHLIIMLENYEEFKEIIENIMKNPIDNRPARKESSENLYSISSNLIDFNQYNFPRLRGLIDFEDRPNLHDRPNLFNFHNRIEGIENLESLNLRDYNVDNLQNRDFYNYRESLDFLRNTGNPNPDYLHRRINSYGSFGNNSENNTQTAAINNSNSNSNNSIIRGDLQNILNPNFRQIDQIRAVSLTDGEEISDNQIEDVNLSWNN
jgi:hypothetical protein